MINKNNELLNRILLVYIHFIVVGVISNQCRYPDYHIRIKYLRTNMILHETQNENYEAANFLNYKQTKLVRECYNREQSIS